ncbi:MAG: hypothetical protein SF162_19575 [bacterium]|nr:hypothetical protein [bacterium]
MKHEPEKLKVRLGDDGELLPVEDGAFQRKRKPKPRPRRGENLIVVVLSLAMIVFLAGVIVKAVTDPYWVCSLRRQCEDPNNYPFSPSAPRDAGPNTNDLIRSPYPMCDLPLPSGIMIGVGFGYARELVIVTVGDERVCRVTANSIDERMAAWSPDRRQIAFITERTIDNAHDVFLLNVESGVIVNLTNDTAYEMHLDWSPDSRQIAYLSSRGKEYGAIFIRALDQAEPRRLTAHVMAPLAREHEPAWSPDGREMLFSASIEFEPTLMDIYRMRLDTPNAQPERLTSNVLFEYNPRWEPEGDAITFAAERLSVTGDNIGSEQYRLRFGVEAWETLQHPQKRFSPDGRYYVHQENDELVIVTRANRAEQRIRLDTFDFEWVDWR